MLAWFYFILMLVGGGFLTLGYIAGELGDFGDGIIGGIDNFLEGLGIDLISDIESGANPFGLRSMAAFATFFGAMGLITTGYFKVGALESILIAIVCGSVASYLTTRLTRFVNEQQASSHISDEDYVGIMAMVSSPIPENGVGMIAVTIRGQRTSCGARTEDGKGLDYGSEVRVLRKEGVTAIVQEVK